MTPARPAPRPGSTRGDPGRGARWPRVRDDVAALPSRRDEHGGGTGDQRGLPGRHERLRGGAEGGARRLARKGAEAGVAEIAVATTMYGGFAHAPLCTALPSGFRQAGMIGGGPRGSRPTIRELPANTGFFGTARGGAS